MRHSVQLPPRGIPEAFQRHPETSHRFFHSQSANGGSLLQSTQGHERQTTSPCRSMMVAHLFYSRCPPCPLQNGLGLESGARSDRFCYDPRLVIVVGQKRHQTRFWPEDASVDGDCNARSMTDVRTDDRPLRLCARDQCLETRGCMSSSLHVHTLPQHCL